MAENQEPIKVEEQGPFIHQLQLLGIRNKWLI